MGRYRLGGVDIAALVAPRRRNDNTCDLDRLGLVRLGLVRPGAVRRGSARLGLVWLGPDRCGAAYVCDHERSGRNGRGAGAAAVILGG